MRQKVKFFLKCFGKTKKNTYLCHMFEMKGKIIFDPINVTKKHNDQSTWKKVAIVKFDCDTYESTKDIFKCLKNLFFENKFINLKLNFLFFKTFFFLLSFF